MINSPVDDTLHNLSAVANIERHPTQRLRCEDCRLVHEDRSAAFLRRSLTGDSRHKVCSFLERTVMHLEEMSQTLKDVRPDTITHARLARQMARAEQLAPSACAGIKTMLKSTYELDHNTEVRLERVEERIKGLFPSSVVGEEEESKEHAGPDAD